MGKKVKPNNCPFCSGEIKFWNNSGAIGGWPAFTCKGKCKMYLKFPRNCRSDDEIVEAFNNLSEVEAMKEVLRQVYDGVQIKTEGDYDMPSFVMDLIRDALGIPEPKTEKEVFGEWQT